MADPISAEFDDLLREHRVFPPPDGVPRAGDCQGRRHLRRGRARSGSVLGRVCRRARMVAAVGPRARLAAAAREVVRRRPAQRQRQLRRSPRPRRAAQQGGDHLGRRAGRSPHAHLLRPLPRSLAVRQRPEVARRRRRAIASRSTCRSFPSWPSRCSACARIGAVHSVVFGGFSAESLRDRINDAAGAPADHRRRRLSPRPDRAAQAGGRRGGRRHAVDRARGRRAARRRRHAGAGAKAGAGASRCR